jgi:hypothetical protein
MKPDIAAPDGTTSLTYGRMGFYGTSAASPVVAGAAALLLQRYPSLTATAIADTLRALARDVGPLGIDSAYGAGLLYVWRNRYCNNTDTIMEFGCMGIPVPCSGIHRFDVYLNKYL